MQQDIELPGCLWKLRECFSKIYIVIFGMGVHILQFILLANVIYLTGTLIRTKTANFWVRGSTGAGIYFRLLFIILALTVQLDLSEWFPLIFYSPTGGVPPGTWREDQDFQFVFVIITQNEHTTSLSLVHQEINPLPLQCSFLSGLRFTPGKPRKEQEPINLNFTGRFSGLLFTLCSCVIIDTFSTWYYSKFEAAHEIHCCIFSIQFLDQISAMNQSACHSFRMWITFYFVNSPKDFLTFPLCHL